MHLTTEERQRVADYWRGKADERESLHRFACQDYTLPPRLPQPPSFEKLTNFSDLQWEEEDRKKKQIDRDELKAFNLKYGYQP